jgi:hypothetical protein
MTKNTVKSEYVSAKNDLNIKWFGFLTPYNFLNSFGMVELCSHKPVKFLNNPGFINLNPE